MRGLSYEHRGSTEPESSKYQRPRIPFNKLEGNKLRCRAGSEAAAQCLLPVHACSVRLQVCMAPAPPSALTLHESRRGLAQVPTSNSSTQEGKENDLGETHRPVGLILEPN